MSDSTHDAPRLNQASAHDTGLYDPAVHDNQIVALYETDADARAAQETLAKAGFAANSMQVVSRDIGSGAAAPAREEGGLWSSIKSLFVPDEERNTYNSAIARGHAMLVVTPDRTMDRQHLIHTLEQTGPLDFDAKLEEWRQAGYDTTGSAAGTPTSNTATAGHAVDAGLNTMPSANAAGVASAAATPAAGLSTGHAAQAPGRAAPTTDTTAKAGAAAAPAAASRDTSPDTIKVMEERLRVGKREVAGGAVRVRSYIVERPVEENVRLHQERVDVERRPVDRPATAADFGAFQERTIEAQATSEEAVVSKEARVVEEIGLNKQESDRTETVRDTVRKTEVEVEGAGDAAAQKGSLPGNAASNPNSTPGATTSGANAPRK